MAFVRECYWPFTYPLLLMKKRKFKVYKWCTLCWICVCYLWTINNFVFLAARLLNKLWSISCKSYLVVWLNKSLLEWSKKFLWVGTLSDLLNKIWLYNMYKLYTQQYCISVLVLFWQQFTPNLNSILLRGENWWS